MHVSLKSSPTVVCSANRRCWLVHALLHSDQGLESDFPRVIEMFAVSAVCVYPLQAGICLHRQRSNRVSRC